MCHLCKINHEKRGRLQLGRALTHLPDRLGTHSINGSHAKPIKKATPHAHLHLQQAPALTDNNGNPYLSNTESNFPLCIFLCINRSSSA